LQRTDLGRLFTAKRDHDGNERLQLFAPWSAAAEQQEYRTKLFRHFGPSGVSEKNTKTGAACQSFLWNLYRRDTTPETRKCSLLFGLFSINPAWKGKRLRMLYVR